MDEISYGAKLRMHRAHVQNAYRARVRRRRGIAKTRVETCRPRSTSREHKGNSYKNRRSRSSSRSWR